MIKQPVKGSRNVNDYVIVEVFKKVRELEESKHDSI